MIFEVFNRAIKSFRQRDSKLVKAIAIKNIAGAKKLLEQEANPNARVNGKSGHPLIFSTFEKNYFALPQGSMRNSATTLYHVTANKESLQLLLEYGADPNLKDESGRTPLDIAILWCMPEIVKLLLIHGADPNFQDRKGITPLMKTAILGIKDARPINNKLQIIMHLIDAGAKIDAQSLEGKTALMYATGNSRIEIVELLVSSGASLSISDRLGNKACDIIGRGVTTQQRAYMERILTQPQLNILKYKYREFIPEGDRLLNPIL